MPVTIDNRISPETGLIFAIYLRRKGYNISALRMLRGDWVWLQHLYFRL